MDEFSIPAEFESVWQRVTAISKQEEIPETIERELARFINELAQGIEIYAQLVRICTGRERQKFLQIKGNLHERQKELQIEYFMLSGDMLKPQYSGGEIATGALSMLRNAYLYEAELSAALEKSAEKRGGALSRLYRNIADSALKNAADIKEIISRAM